MFPLTFTGFGAPVCPTLLGSSGGISNDQPASGPVQGRSVSGCHSHLFDRVPHDAGQTHQSAYMSLVIRVAFA